MSGGAEHGYEPLVEIMLLLGAAEFEITDADARRLERAIRRNCVDESGRPLDEDARACLQLADVLAEDLSHGESP